MHPILLSVAIFSGGPALHSHAFSPLFCSVAAEDGTRGLTKSVTATRALLTRADVIVRARALRQSPREEPGGWLPFDVEFEVLSILKGEPVPPLLRIMGVLSDEDDFNPAPVPYVWGRPEAMRGSCFAYSYRRDGEFLLLLKRESGALTPYWAALAPVNEQIRGAEDPWLGWVHQQLQR